MYIRCAQCGVSSRVESLETGRVSCGHCGREYVFTPGSAAGLDHHEASRYARAHGIDLPAAGSVLLGILTLDQARAFAEGKRMAPQEQPAKPRPRRDPVAGTRLDTGVSGRRSTELPYDPGFAGAVARGQLSATAAIQRGDREKLIRHLAQRYDLPDHLAEQVADNKLNVRAAVQASETTTEPERRSGFRLSGAEVLVTALCLTLVGLIVMAAVNRFDAVEIAEEAPVFDPEPVSPATAVLIREKLDASTETRRSESGELVEIVGPDPRSVLRTFCAESSSTSELEALDIVPSVPPTAGTRLGTYRDPSSPFDTYAVTIRRNHATGRWFVGDGVKPIASIPRPRSPLEARPLDSMVLAEDAPTVDAE
ncbi:MAG: hypothetical protein R3344_09005 [Acidobacteriota bacterium]|nr:hypothetical protein [Acidobacteriota bacterium]